MARDKKHQENKAEAGAIAERLNELRGELSVSAFARKCGIGASMMRNYFEGASPGHDRLAQIAKANGVTIDWLATGEGPRQRSALSQIGLARDAAMRFALKRSTVPEIRISELMQEAFDGQLDEDGLERLHGREYPLGAAERSQRYVAVDTSRLRSAIEAVEARMPVMSTAAKASAAAALYEHASATGKWDLESLHAFLDLVAGAREDDYKLSATTSDEERMLPSREEGKRKK